MICSWHSQYWPTEDIPACVCCTEKQGEKEERGNRTVRPVTIVSGCVSSVTVMVVSKEYCRMDGRRLDNYLPLVLQLIK